MVRPRGWHLPEKHILVNGRPCSGSIFDFAFYFFHNAKALTERGSGGSPWPCHGSKAAMKGCSQSSVLSISFSRCPGAHEAGLKTMVATAADCHINISV